MTDHGRCDQLGNLFSFDYMITTNEGVTVLMASGQPVWRDIFAVCRQTKPDVLLRQAGFKIHGEQISAEKLGALLLNYHAKVIIPYYQELMINQYGKEWADRYFLQVKHYIEENNHVAQFIVPDAWKWHCIGLDMRYPGKRRRTIYDSVIPSEMSYSKHLSKFFVCYSSLEIFICIFCVFHLSLYI